MPPEIDVDYDNIIPQNQDRPLFYEILVKFTYLVGMILIKTFMTYFLRFFILRL